MQTIQDVKTFILQSSVLDSVLADPKLAVGSSLANPITAERELRRQLRIDCGWTDRYLVISYRDRNAVQAANVCNAVTSSFLQVRESVNEKRTEELIRWLAPTISQWRSKVQNHREQIVELEKAAGTQTDTIAKVGTSMFSAETSEMFFAKQDYQQSCEILEKLNRRLVQMGAYFNGERYSFH